MWFYILVLVLILIACGAIGFVHRNGETEIFLKANAGHTSAATSLRAPGWKVYPKDRNATSRHEGAPDVKSCGVCQPRRLWLDHVFFTREVAALTILQVPEAITKVSIDTLLQNQVEIAQWFQNKVATVDTPESAVAIQVVVQKLLTTHIKQALAITIGLRDGQSMDTLTSQWYANAQQIADGIASIGTAYGWNWQADVLRPMMKQHLKLTTDEILLFIKGDAEGAMAAFKRVKEEIIGMSDYLVQPFRDDCSHSER